MMKNTITATATATAKGFEIIVTIDGAEYARFNRKNAPAFVSVHHGISYDPTCEDFGISCHTSKKAADKAVAGSFWVEAIAIPVETV